MARLKKPENETENEALVRREKETIANNATRNEKVSWDRKMDNMVSLLALLQPIEEQITDLTAQKMPIIDRIQALRTDMVKECVHPYTHLVHHEDYIVCKFCDKKFTIQN
ncbi:MAG: hypothetical protein CTY12_04900 [Methylotenera sp.]|nr:MAG: hypothetical protein CTY12_04900 [Methylotenera sp.]